MTVCGVHRTEYNRTISGVTMLSEGFFYMHMCMCTGNKGNKLWFEVGVEDGDRVAKDQDVS